MSHDADHIVRSLAPSLAPRQLVLALDHAISFAREDFLEGPSNAKALAMIERWPDWPDRLAVLGGQESSRGDLGADDWRAYSVGQAFG